MSLNKVVEDIIRKGEEKKRETIQLGQKERDEQVLQVDKKIQENRIKAEKRTDAMIVQMEQQEVSSAELESKKTLLAAERQSMEELKAQVLEELARYPVDKKKRAYFKLVSKAKKELGDCNVYSSKEDKALVQLPTGVSYGGTIQCRGGLVFETKDRSVRLDFRFESILDDVWNKNMKEIHTRLFG